MPACSGPRRKRTRLSPRFIAFSAVAKGTFGRSEPHRIVKFHDPDVHSPRHQRPQRIQCRCRCRLLPSRQLSLPFKSARGGSRRALFAEFTWVSGASRPTRASPASSTASRADPVDLLVFRGLETLKRHSPVDLFRCLCASGARRMAPTWRRQIGFCRQVGYGKRQLMVRRRPPISLQTFRKIREGNCH